MLSSVKYLRCAKNLDCGCAEIAILSDLRLSFIECAAEPSVCSSHDARELEECVRKSFEYLGRLLNSVYRMPVWKPTNQYILEIMCVARQVFYQ